MASRDERRLHLTVLVKAAPVLTSRLDETMCVAGVEAAGQDLRWVRLHPVPFRDLDDEHRFRKYQEIEVDVFRPTSDRRPESWSPLAGTIQLGASIPAEKGWSLRRHLVDALPRYEMCDLVEMNEMGSGRVPSLAVVQPTAPPELVISERDAEQIDVWQRRAAAAAGRLTLFDDASAPKPPFEVVKWRFRYHYRCAKKACRGHRQTIVDWEALALWRRVRDRPDWRDAMRDKFEREMWRDRDSVLFVGNQQEHPTSFLVLGVFWPPNVPVQQVLV